MRRRITAEVDGSIFVIRGWQAHRLAIEAGLRPTYNGVRAGWVSDTSKLPTFEAYCAHRNVWLEVTGVEPMAVVPAAGEPDQAEAVDDVPLFEWGRS